MSTTLERATAWIIGHDTGSSSKAIWAVMMGQEGDGDSPHDGADLGRCLRLLEAIPEWKARLPEMKPVSAYWAALVEHWDELARLHEDPDHSKVYNRMRAILDPIEDGDPTVVRMSKGVTVQFGRSRRA